MRLLSAVLNQPWAIEPNALRTIVDVVTRDRLDAELARQIRADRAARPSAVAFRKAQRLAGTSNVALRDGVAIVPVTGPIVRYSDFFTEVSGLTSIETLARDVQTALDSPDVRSLLLVLDSPGGEVGGVSVLSDRLYSARGSKKVWAYVDGMAASAGYWLASSATHIVTDPTSMIGSIGAVLAMGDPSKANTQTIEFVSSQSPLKRASPLTAAGQAEYQRLVDQLAEVFVGAVARNRKVSTETVLTNYGRGGMLVGEHAVAAGLADAVGSFEGTLESLAAGRPLPAKRAAGASLAADAELAQVRASAAAYASRANGQRPTEPTTTTERRRELPPLTPEGRAVLADGDAAAAAKAWAKRQNRKRP